jgi:hypothetical protein
MIFRILIFIYKITNKKLEVKTVKGIELPINILVIVAVAIIVLLGVIALFYSSWFTSTGPVSSQSAISAGCNSASRMGCSVVEPSSIAVTYKTYVNLALFCNGEYPGAGFTVAPPVPPAVPAAGSSWAANGVDAKKCLTLACGMGC